MKRILLISTLLNLFLVSSSAFSQQTNSIIRMTACNINSGFSMADVVSIAKDMPWNENSPNGIFFREPVAYTGTTPTWDFLVAAYYNGYADMVLKRGALRNLKVGRVGLIGDDIATCSTLGRIIDVHPANPGIIFDDTEATLMTTRTCELNEETTPQDAVAIATKMGANLDVSSQVTVRRYGGPSITGNNLINMAFVYSDPADFGETLDLITEGKISPNTGLDNGAAMTCNTGSLWVSHRIHLVNN
jgi:hypothetical protein|tara:strand:- start:12959 stop:13696 length:738 start_codon:yes stop_codon:yes gene_type:complete